MQFWEPNSRSFVDLLDSFTEFPFLKDLPLVEPGALLEPLNLSVLLHEYTHLACIAGPISIFSAFQTGMSYAMRELCRLRAERGVEGLDLTTFGRIDLQGQSQEYISAAVYLDRYSHYYRNYVNFFNAYRWLFEGLALFVEWDYAPGLLPYPGSPVLEFVESLLASRRNGAPVFLREEVARCFAEMRAAAQKKEWKWTLFNRDEPTNRDYFAGYLLVKQLWRVLAGRDARLADPDLFLRFCLAFVFHDWGLLDLCSTPQEADVFGQEKKVKQAIRAFQKNSLEQILAFDAEYLDGLIGALNRDRASIWMALSDQNGFIYSSSARHDAVLYQDPETMESEVLARIDAEIDRAAAALFSPAVEGYSIRSEVAKIKQASQDLFRLMRSHHSVFKLHHSSRRFVGSQQKGDRVRAAFIFNAGPSMLAWSFLTAPAQKLAPLLKTLEGKGKANLRFPRQGVDLFELERMGAAKLDRVLKELPQAESVASLDTHDFYDTTSHEWIQVLDYGGQRLVINTLGRSDRVTRPDEIERVAQSLNRDSYWERLKLPIGVYPDGYDYYAEYLMVDSPVSSAADFMDGILHAAWRIVFGDGAASDAELDRFWQKRLPGLVIRDEPSSRLAKDILAQDGFRVDAADAARRGRIEAMNKRWRARTGAPLFGLSGPGMDGKITVEWLF